MSLLALGASAILSSATTSECDAGYYALDAGRHEEAVLSLSVCLRLSDTATPRAEFNYVWAAYYLARAYDDLGEKILAASYAARALDVAAVVDILGDKHQIFLDELRKNGETARQSSSPGSRRRSVGTGFEMSTDRCDQTSTDVRLLAAEDEIITCLEQRDGRPASSDDPFDLFPGDPSTSPVEEFGRLEEFGLNTISRDCEAVLAEHRYCYVVYDYSCMTRLYSGAQPLRRLRCPVFFDADPPQMEQGSPFSNN